MNLKKVSDMTREFYNNEDRNDRALNIRDVCELTTISPAGWYRLINSDGAPAPIKLGRKSVWMRSSVLDYLRSKQQALDAA
jgi:predicted DNA-binding transcriptional regulator AlpA